ncbi:FAD/NADP-binding domain-containing protein [Dacryopinax primogenitus]|uniref:FAD/NADP-binding domain-containing protein n=1 Tax=Dacryopinax primogenitus (strain DJM 731) TaxID=1858805 RepID=M5GG00_DACPD|nr:FAD/NADP-binding domain-containing protein [Dacryopinax primogenitus]EJU04623.1 FAD/NADP-binding domain-containing protein [Dacryopinax primogenitus]
MDNQNGTALDKDSKNKVTPTRTKIYDWRILYPLNMINHIFKLFYMTVQLLIVSIFKPRAPKTDGPLKRPYGRIAVIGAGLTGISTAAHAISHNFEVEIFEKNDAVGGIWAHVNRTSGLQLNSLLYRFHPGVLWTSTFPKRDEILNECRRLWREYKLESRTRLNTTVTSVTRADSSTDPAEGGHGRWMVNGEGPFDAVVVTIGTCGDKKDASLKGLEDYNGLVVHSSELDDVDLKDKRVVVVGSGASGVEAVQLACEKKSGPVTIIARHDKWIIPRNIFFDTALSLQPFGREIPLSWIPEDILRIFHYGRESWVSPAQLGLFEGTPIVNDEFLTEIHENKCKYVRGDVLKATSTGVKVNVRGRSSSPNDAGSEEHFDADVIVMATGFKRPSVDFLPAELFPERYHRPNLYLQNFSVEDWSILLTNTAYINAIGTVGHFHIGIYLRVLLCLLLDPAARPFPEDMKLWVDLLRWLKRDSAGGALSFFTYMELTLWLISFHFFRPERLNW